MATVSRCPRCGTQLAHYQGQPYCPDCTVYTLASTLASTEGGATVNVTLTVAEQAKLTEVNRLLTELTDPHDSGCYCMLCEARMLIEVQDTESASIENVILAD
jgi:uncharacterized Zn finger protein (UPF0148 family)